MSRTASLTLLTALLAGSALVGQASPAGAPEPLPPGAMAPVCCGQPPRDGHPGVGPMGHRPGPEAMEPAPMAPPFLPLLRFLNLSPDQDQAVKAVLAKHREAVATRREALRSAAAAFHDGVEDPALSETQLRALLAAESSARMQAALADRAVVTEIQGLLAPEQRAKAERLRLKMQAERAARREVMAEMGGAADAEGRP